MISGLPGIMNLAAASGEDLASVSDIVTDALTAFGLKASDSGHFADVLAKTASSANTNVGLMGETFKYVAPVAGAMGYSIEDTAVAIGMMANAGIKGSEAGTALRAVFSRLAKPPKDAAAAIQALGIKTTDATGNMLPLSDVLGQLREKFSGLSQEQKVQMASSLAGTEAMSGLLAIVNAAEEDYDSLTEAIANASGAAELQAFIMSDNLKGAMDSLKSSIEGIGILFYEQIDSPLKEVVNNATGYVRRIQGLYDDIAAITPGSTLITEGVKAFDLDESGAEHFADVIAKTAESTNVSIGSIGKSFQEVIPLAGTLGFTVEDTAASIGLLTNAGIEGEKAGKALNELLVSLVNPSQEATQSIEQLGLQLKDAEGNMLPLPGILGELRAGFSGLTQEEQEQAAAILTGSSVGSDAMLGLMAMVNSTEEDFNSLTASIENAKGAANWQDTSLEFDTKVNEYVERGYSEGDANKQANEDIVSQSFLEQVPVEIGNILAEVLTQIAEAAPQVIDAAVSLVQAFLQGILNNAESIANGAVSLVFSLVQGITSLIPQIIQTGMDLIIQLALGLAQGAPEVIPQAIGNIIEAIQISLSKQEAMIQAATSLLKGLAEGISKAIPMVVKVIPDIIKGIVLQITELLPAILEVGLSLLLALAKGIVEALPLLIESLPQIIEGIIQFIVTALPMILESGVEILLALIVGIVKSIPVLIAALPQIIVAIVNGIISLVDGLWEAGKNIVDGLWKGISDAREWLLGKVREWCGSILKGIKSFFGISSPSRVMKQLFEKDWTEGIVLGIKAGQQKVTATVRSMSEAAYKVAKDAAKSYAEIGSYYVELIAHGMNSKVDELVESAQELVDAQIEAYKKSAEKQRDAQIAELNEQAKKVKGKKKEQYEEEIAQLKENTADGVKEYTKAAKAMMSSYAEALKGGAEEVQEVLNTKIKGITDSFQEQYDEIIRLKESMEEKMADFGDLFSIDDETGEVNLSNLQDNIEALDEYNEALSALKERDISGAFLNEVTSLGIEEGTKFAKKLLSLTVTQFETYVTNWETQQSKAKEIAEQFYADELEALQADFSGKLDKALAEVPQIMENIGKDSIDGWIEGMQDKSGDLYSAVQGIANQMLEQLRESLDINSPSGKTKEMIGVPAAEGVEVGFVERMKKAYGRMQEAVMFETGKISTNVTVQANRAAAVEGYPRQIETFHNNNVIERTPVIEFSGDLAPLGRLLYPHIKMEEKRIGNSLAKGVI